MNSKITMKWFKEANVKEKYDICLSKLWMNKRVINEDKEKRNDHKES